MTHYPPDGSDATPENTMPRHSHCLCGHHAATIMANPPWASRHDAIHHPAHYTRNGFTFADDPECITFTRNMGFCDGNAFKYIWRSGCKGDWEADLAKARFYINDLNEHNLGRQYPLLVDILELVSPGETRINAAKLTVLRRILQNRLFSIESHLKELEDALAEDDEAEEEAYRMFQEAMREEKEELEKEDEAQGEAKNE